MRRRCRLALLTTAAVLAACEGELFEGRLYSDGVTPGMDGAVVDGGANVDGGLSGPDAGEVAVVCGDGVVGAGETCDPPGSCPGMCDDGAACTMDVRTGDPSTCDVACDATVVEACADGDGCCPGGCDSTTDGDCSESCGNGVVEAGETCDPPGSCPTSCDDGVACTTDRLSGSADACSAECSHVAITSCVAGDGCCPAGCNATTDSDCSAVCGNGVIEGVETCDPPSSCPSSCDDGMACTMDGTLGSAASCTLVCTHVTITACANGDGCCPAGCNATTDGDCTAMCGNGVVEGGETCDPPSSCPSSCDDGMVCTTDTRTGAATSCNVQCTNSAITACTGGDGCCPSACSAATDSDCVAVCGDGACTVAAGELCTSCAADCNTTATVCGNGACQSGETSASCLADCGPSPWTSGWATWESEVVTLFNMHRAAGTDCPSGAKSPVGAVTMEGPLQTASRLHSWDQSYSNYFSHTSCNGRTFTQRASAQGTSAFGEIIARGQTSPASAVSSWMASTSGHCDIIMNGSYTRVGVGYAQASGGARLWTGMFR